MLRSVIEAACLESTSQHATVSSESSAQLLSASNRIYDMFMIKYNLCVLQVHITIRTYVSTSFDDLLGRRQPNLTENFQTYNTQQRSLSSCTGVQVLFGLLTILSSTSMITHNLRRGLIAYLRLICIHDFFNMNRCLSNHYMLWAGRDTISKPY